MASLKDALRRLNASDLTCREITTLYKHADILTKTGSGRTWSYGQNALAAVCAFTASERLGNNEISKDQARTAACIDAKTFEAALSAARRILFAPTLSKSNQSGITYHTLLKQYNVKRDDASVIMMEVQHRLKNNNVDTTSAAMQGGIFCWVCINILDISLPVDEHMRRSINVTLKDWSGARRTIEKYCTSMMSSLIQNAETAMSRKTCSRTASSRAITDPFATVMTPNRPIVLMPASVDSGTSKTQAMKRKVSSENLRSRETPLKRLKGLPCTPPKLGQDHAPKRGNAASKVRFFPSCQLDKIIQPDDDSDEDSLGEAIVVQCRKPSDYSAFFTERPSDPAKTPGPVKVSFEAPSIINSPERTPMTSTGASETSLNPPRLVKARDGLAPITANKRLFSVIEVEEPSRWRRRNLHAPFLDHGLYGWRLTPSSAKRSALARNWERNMIKKTGDPWDSL